MKGAGINVARSGQDAAVQQHGIAASKWNLLLTSVLCVVFSPLFLGVAGIGVYMMIRPGPMAARLGVGLPFVLMGGLVTWYLARTFWLLQVWGFAKQPWMVSDEKELRILDFLHRGYRGVSWAEIESIEIAYVKNQEIVVARDAGPYLREMRAVRRWSFRRHYGKLKKMPALGIAIGSLSGESGEILDWCLGEWNAWVERNNS